MTEKWFNYTTSRSVGVSIAAASALLPSSINAAEGSGMPQFDISTFPTQLTWLAITFALLFFAMHQVALPRIADVLEARRNRIGGDLDRAQIMKEEAEAALAAYEKTLAESMTKAHELQLEMAAAFTEQAALARSKLAVRLAEETQVAEGLISEEKARSLAGIRDIAAELVCASASRLAGMELSVQDAATAIASIEPKDER